MWAGVKGGVRIGDHVKLNLCRVEHTPECRSKSSLLGWVTYRNLSPLHLALRWSPCVIASTTWEWSWFSPPACQSRTGTPRIPAVQTPLACYSKNRISPSANRSGCNPCCHLNHHNILDWMLIGKLDWILQRLSGKIIRAIPLENVQRLIRWVLKKNNLISPSV